MNVVKTPFLTTLLLCGLTLAVYSFGICDSFKTLDDQVSIVHNEDIRSFANAGKIMTSSFFGGDSYYRPLVTLSFMLEYRAFGLNAFYYYLVNILLHTANAMIVGGIVHYLFRSRGLALGVALLFAIHPIHWEAVSNIPGRAIILCAFFYLKAFYLFCLSSKRKFFYFLSLASFALALLCKESAGVLPLLLCSYQFFVNRKPGERFPRYFLPVVPFFAVAAVYVLARKFLGMTHLFYWPSVNAAALGFLTFLRSVITDLRLLVWPMDLYFDRSAPLLTGFMSPGGIATVLFFLTAGTLFLKFRTRFSGKEIFFITWFAVELLPVSQILVTIGVQPGFISTAEHFLYTPSVGIFILAALAAQRAGKFLSEKKLLSPGGVRMLLAGIYGFFLLLTVQYNIYSSNEIAMFEQTLKLNPTNTRIRVSLALVYARLNRFDVAEDHFRRVLEIEPYNVRARIGLGKALCDQGKLWDGIVEYDKVIVAGEEARLLETNRRLTYQALLRNYDELLRREPENAGAYHSVGVVHSRMGHPQEAIPWYLKAVSLRPDMKDALFNLASSLAAVGETARAIETLQRMLTLPGPGNELDRQAERELERLYQRQGVQDKAAAP